MPDHTHIASRNAQRDSHFLSGAIVIESHHENGALPLRQALEALLEASRVERIVGGFDHRRQALSEGVQEALAPTGASPAVDGDLATGAENEGCEFFRFANGTRAQLLKGHDQDVLDEVRRCRLTAQVAQAVQPYARRKAPAELGLSGSVPVRRSSEDLPGERAVFGKGCQVVHLISIGAARLECKYSHAMDV